MVAQQSFLVSVTEHLPGQGSDLAVLGQNVVVPLGRDVFAAGAGQHAAAVSYHGQDFAGRPDERSHRVAPAAQWIVNVVQGRLRHGVYPVKIS